jgi:hypothetical protein
MKLYRVDVGPAQIGSGEIIGLTSEQADPRLHNLEALEAGPDIDPSEGRIPYRVINPMQFKVGELIEIAQGPSRSQQQFLVDVEAETAAKNAGQTASTDPRQPRTGAAATPTPGQQLPDRSTLTRDERFTPGEKKRPRSKGELHDAILAATDRLNAHDPGTFTADGKPQVNALEAVLGYAITADERDEAWAKKPA